VLHWHEALEAAEKEKKANIVFSHALKLLGSEAALSGCHFTNECDVSTSWKPETRPPSSAPSSLCITGSRGWPSIGRARKIDDDGGGQRK